MGMTPQYELLLFSPEKVRERGSGLQTSIYGIVLRAEGVKKCLLRKLGLCLALGRFLKVGSRESLFHSSIRKEICALLASNILTTL